MTIEEAIKHCDEVANNKCNRCGVEYKQLSQWLRELKKYREATKESSVALDRLRRCMQAEKLVDGNCRGYQKSRFDDEPTERCKQCKEFELYEEN